MDSTHKTNKLGWYLFTVMVRDEGNSWIPYAYFLSMYEDGDILATTLRQIKEWCRPYTGWKLRYFITDDSAAEQRAVKLAFRGLIDGEIEVSHFLCRVHSERTLRRNLSPKKYSTSFAHLYKALYIRHTKPSCEDEIRTALRSTPPKKQRYIEREWWDTREKWAYYARQHSCLLLQCMSTNGVDSWYSSLKKYAEGIQFKFSLAGTVSHVDVITQQWVTRAQSRLTKVRVYKSVECQEYPQLEYFTGPVQELLVEQLRRAKIVIRQDDDIWGELDEDELTCTCLFYRQYQLLCRHI